MFSGIGSIEWALQRLKLNHKIIFSCDNGGIQIDIEDIEKVRNKVKSLKTIKEQNEYIKNIYSRSRKTNFVKKSYLANYDVEEDNFLYNIRFLDGTKYKNKIDLFVGGSPCQSFSISGNRLGLNDARGTLFYDYARLIKEIQPKVFIYENVPGMLNHDKGNTFKIILEILKSLDYNLNIQQINSKDYGIPQNRNRLFIVGFRKDLNIGTFSFPKPKVLTKKTSDYLEETVDRKYFYAEKGFKCVVKKESLKRRVSINADICRTQTSNQQTNRCGDMVFKPIELEAWAENDERVYVSNFKGTRGVIRMLTPRECLRLMGYDDNFKIVVSDSQMYKQCGNSIVVNVLEEIMKEITNYGLRCVKKILDLDENVIIKDIKTDGKEVSIYVEFEKAEQTSPRCKAKVK